MTPHWCYAVTNAGLVRVWCPSGAQAEGLASSYRKLYPDPGDAWIEECDETAVTF